MDIVDNSNISSEHLNGSGLHLSRKWKGKLWNWLRNTEYKYKVEKVQIEIDNKVDTIWLCLIALFLIVYIAMILKENGIHEVLNIF